MKGRTLTLDVLLKKKRAGDCDEPGNTDFDPDADANFTENVNQLILFNF